MRFSIFILCLLVFTPLTFANPYWDPNQVPKDSMFASSRLPLPNLNNLKTITKEEGIEVLRVQVDWQEANETYTITQSLLEKSGTPTLLARSKQKPQLGSYLGQLKDVQSGEIFAYASIGTGKEYRKLTRAISFRFPIPQKDFIFEMYAENPRTGVMEKVITHHFVLGELQQSKKIADVEIKQLALATQFPSVRVNLYAEGYLANEKEIFWQHAMKAIRALQHEKFPGVEYMSFYGVFHASNEKLGPPERLGMPVPERNSFLGLYYPYWNDFGRWYNVVYPTRENKLRQGYAVAPYDYPIVLVNNKNYWGMGNYMVFTALPAQSSYFTYLLFHEFGHFFGLNEEYKGGGRTELEFAPGIKEPWSQNITFLNDKRYEKLKWKSWVDPTMELPTPRSRWKPSPPIYGAYAGGYADSRSMNGSSHIPGLNCTMESKKYFCDICKQAIQEIVKGQA